MSLFARFSAMYGTVVGPASDGQRKALKDIHRAYDMQQHGRGAGTQASPVTGEFARNLGDLWASIPLCRPAVRTD